MIQMTVPAALLCLALTLLCAALFLALRRVRRAIVALNLQTEQHRQQRVALDAVKDQLIGNVSHELRTPLTSIRGALGLLSAGPAEALDPRSQHLLRIALTNTDRLIRLVTDILDLERMASGQAGLHFRRCSLAQLIQQAIETIAPNAEAARVTLRFNSATAVPQPPSPPPAQVADPQRPAERRKRRGPDALSFHPATPEPGFFDADPDRILQVLNNLLSNAIKFSPPESAVDVTLTASPTALHMRVADQGRGIPEAKLEAIFDRFQQVEVTDSRQKGGTGLGLAICRTIVEQHGGAIRAERNPAGGASFLVDLPRLERFADHAKTPQPAPADTFALST